ncbi:hypothetical protein [uncultured Microbacterium sp.]|nr:hypothetical protein [uncultured Microbacterium sp.]
MPITASPRMISSCAIRGAGRATGSVVLTALDGSGSDHRPLIVQLERTSG